MPNGKKKKRHKMSTHKRKKRLRKNRHKSHVAVGKLKVLRAFTLAFNFSFYPHQNLDFYKSILKVKRT